jgi:hypothetical protein
MRRVTDELLDEVLRAVATRLVPRRRGRKRKKAVVAVDATGLEPGSISTFFINRRADRGEGLPWRHWCKWTIVVDVLRRCVLAQAARQGPWNDCATLRPLVSAAHEVTPVGLVLADAEFDSERNHRHVRDVVGAESIIPAKRGKAEWKIKGVRAQMRRRFPRRCYSQRAQVESVFSVVKRKLSAKAPGRSTETQGRQAMLLGLAYNIYLFRLAGEAGGRPRKPSHPPRASPPPAPRSPARGRCRAKDAATASPWRLVRSSRAAWRSGRRSG